MLDLQTRPDSVQAPTLGKTYLGLRDLEQGEEDRLTDALHAYAQEASHADDLVQTACHWLFTRRILIPGPRRLLDLARDAFAAVEAQILAHVSAAVPAATVQELSTLAYSVRPGTDATQLEWLRPPSKRHGPTTLAETLEKVRVLKALGAHSWDLSDVALAKQRQMRWSDEGAHLLAQVRVHVINNELRPRAMPIPLRQPKPIPNSRCDAELLKMAA